DAGVDARRPLGSYAGAMGIPQFMPGAWRQYAVDYDGDGRADLAGSAADAIGSVANFLRQHGWATDQPIALAVPVDAGPAQVRAVAQALAAAGVKPLFRMDELATLNLPGMETLPALPGDMPVSLIELASAGEASEYRLGFGNFYVLTRY